MEFRAGVTIAPLVTIAAILIDWPRALAVVQKWRVETIASRDSGPNQNAYRRFEIPQAFSARDTRLGAALPIRRGVHQILFARAG